MDAKQFRADKILAHLDRVEEWLEAGISRPITYELFMTNICNNRCPRCFGFCDRVNRKDSLTEDEARDFVYQIKEFGGRGLTFTGGGEPLCNPHTIKAVEYAKGIGLDVGFITNGLSIDEDVAKVLLRNCTWLRISLDAATSEMYEFTHGMDGEAFEKVLDNIRLLVKIKKELNTDCTLGTGYLTSSETKKEIYKFALLCKTLGVDYAQFRPLLKIFGRQERGYSYNSKKEIIGEIKKAIKLSKDDYQILYSQHKYDSIVYNGNSRSYEECYGHHFATVIGPDKKMYICCHLAGVERYCIGDLNKMSLKEIWYSEQRKRVDENIALEHCIYLCRCNTFNTILWNIRQEKVHANFI